MTESDDIDEQSGGDPAALLLMSRRTLLKRGAGLAAGVAALGVIPGILEACTSAATTAPRATATSALASAAASAAAPSAAASVAAASAAAGATTGMSTDALFSLLWPGSGSAIGQGLTLEDGMSLAMTGAGAWYGQVMSRGAQLAAKQILAHGGPKVDINIIDHQNGDPTAALNGVQKLINLNHISTLQTSYGAASEAIVPLIEQYKVLSFNGGGASPGQLGKDFLWQTRMVSGFISASGTLAWVAKTYPSIKTIIAVGTKENEVEAVTEKLPHDWPILCPDGKLFTPEWATVGQTDFSTIVARVKASGADMVYTTTFGPDQGYLVKQLREGGYNGLIISTQGEADSYAASGGAMDTNFYFTGDFLDTTNKNPLTVQFVQAHTAAYGIAPEFFGANYYEHVVWFWDLMQRVIKNGGDPTSGAQLQAALKANPTFPSVWWWRECSWHCDVQSVRPFHRQASRDLLLRAWSSKASPGHQEDAARLRSAHGSGEYTLRSGKAAVAGRAH